jgi:hypothetical protein
MEDYAQFVHEFRNKNGEVRFAVARWDEERGQYTRPLSQRDIKLTGCSEEYTKKISTFGGYPTRCQARRRARYVFGGK